MKRQTQRERKQIKSELGDKFRQWNKMTDDELLATVKIRWPAVAGLPERGDLLRFLVMDHLDKIN